MNLKKAKKFLEEKWYNICYIWIYWSQNYWLDINSKKYQSDVDYKAVCVPTLRDLVDNSKPISKSYEFEWWLIDIKDIRVWTETLVKCNPAYVETLYTPHCWYSEEYKLIINKRDNLINEMWVFLLKACYGMILEKVKAFSHPYPSIKDKIDKFWYDPKQLHHIVRLCLLMNNFVDKWEFIMLNTENENEFLIDIKLWKYNLDEAISLREHYLELSKNIRDKYKIEPNFKTKKEIIQLSKDLIYNRIVNKIMDN